MPGLNRAQREIVRGLMDRGVSDEYLARQIERMAIWHKGWDYRKNVELCRELALDDYTKAAETLERLINL